MGKGTAGIALGSEAVDAKFGAKSAVDCDDSVGFYLKSVDQILLGPIGTPVYPQVIFEACTQDTSSKLCLANFAPFA